MRLSHTDTSDIDKILTAWVQGFILSAEYIITFMLHVPHKRVFEICRVTDEDMPGYLEPPTSLWRRYSEFELLKSYLEAMYPAFVIPPLPEKRVRIT